jgi:hypothetical protein
MKHVTILTQLPMMDVVPPVLLRQAGAVEAALLTPSQLLSLALHVEMDSLLVLRSVMTEILLTTMDV